MDISPSEMITSTSMLLSVNKNVYTINYIPFLIEYKLFLSIRELLSYEVKFILRQKEVFSVVSKFILTFNLRK